MKSHLLRPTKKTMMTRRTLKIVCDAECFSRLFGFCDGRNVEVVCFLRFNHCVQWVNMNMKPKWSAPRLHQCRHWRLLSHRFWPNAKTLSMEERAVQRVHLTDLTLVMSTRIWYDNVLQNGVNILFLPPSYCL